MGRRPSKVELNTIERRLLEKELNRQHISKQYEYRIRIILLCSKSEDNNQISKQTGYSKATVSKWRNRWSSNYGRLQAFRQGSEGKGVSEKKLLAELLTILGDAPRSGTPPTITLSQRQQIQALACESPESLGLPFTHWTHKELAKAIVDKKIVESISASHTGRILKKRFISPQIGVLDPSPH